MLQATLRPKAAIVSKKQIIFTFFPFKSLSDQIDLGVKWVKGKPGT